MSEQAHGRIAGASGLEFAYEWYLRAIGVWCIVLGLLYWTRLIGLYDDQIWRFDIMPLHWQVAAVVLAVLFPIAGTGL